MSRARTLACVRAVVLGACGSLLSGGIGQASAQTTVVLSSPSQVFDAAVRGGAYASSNFDKQVLVTRASGTIDYVRRAFVKFDTESTIPEDSTVASAFLTLTVKGGNSETRTLGAYSIETSFAEDEVTWNRRYADMTWSESGGDLGPRYAEATVRATEGSTVTFDVTRLVQEVVRGTYGSRYTRVALVDTGDASVESYREYYPSEASDASVRPRLTVTYGGTSTGGSTSGSTSGGTAASGSTSGTSTTLRVLQWNSHHGGIGTDGVYNPLRLVRKAVSFNPDIVSFNEVDNEAQAIGLASLFTLQTGRTWRYAYDGRGNAIVTRLRIESESTCLVNAGEGRRAVRISTVVNGRTVNVWSAHLDVGSSSTRTSEVRALINCMDDFAQSRLAVGDFNMQAGSAEWDVMTGAHEDAWPRAKALGASLNYPANCDGCTRNSRIDYVFRSTGATALRLRSAQIYDSRDSNGIMPSDHKPMLVVYTVS